MGKYAKFFLKLMSAQADGSIDFNELLTFLQAIGFVLARVSGSHHILYYKDIPELIDLHPDKHDHSKAKTYQVRQVRTFIKKYNVEVDIS